MSKTKKPFAPRAGIEPAETALAVSEPVKGEIVSLAIGEKTNLASVLNEEFNRNGIINYLEMEPGESRYLAVVHFFGVHKDKDQSGKPRKRVYWLAIDWEINGPVILPTSPGFGKIIAKTPIKVLAGCSIPFNKPKTQKDRWSTNTAAARPFSRDEIATLNALQARVKAAVSSVSDMLHDKAEEMAGPTIG